MDPDDAGLCKIVWDMLVIGLVLGFGLTEGLECRLTFEAELVNKTELGLTLDTAEDD